MVIGASSTIAIYKLADEEWELRDDLKPPTEFSYRKAWTLGSRYYFLGGMTSSVTTNEVWEFKDEKWIAMHPMKFATQARIYHLRTVVIP